MTTTISVTIWLISLISAYYLFSHFGVKALSKRFALKEQTEQIMKLMTLILVFGLGTEIWTSGGPDRIISEKILSYAQYGFFAMIFFEAYKIAKESYANFVQKKKDVKNIYNISDLCEESENGDGEAIAIVTELHNLVLQLEKLGHAGYTPFLQEGIRKIIRLLRRDKILHETSASPTISYTTKDEIKKFRTFCLDLIRNDQVKTEEELAELIAEMRERASMIEEAETSLESFTLPEESEERANKKQTKKEKIYTK